MTTGRSRTSPFGGYWASRARYVSTGTAVCGAIAVVVVSLFAFVSPVAAQDPFDCSQPVVDTSGLVDVAEVEQALASVNPAVTIVIRSYNRVPGGNLVSAVDDVVVSCFGDAENGVRDDVVVLGLSIDDRLSDVLVGSGWGIAVPDPDQLRADVMGVRFAEGDYTGGLVAAIEVIDAGVERQLGVGEASPASGDDGEAQEGETQDGETAGDAAPTQEPAGETSGDGQSPWAIGGGLAGIGGCGAIFLLVNRHRKLSSAREELERATAAPLARLGVLRERDARMTAQGDVWSKTTNGRTLVNLRVRLRESEASRAATDRAAGLYNQAIPEGVGNAGQAEITRARDRVMELSRALDLQDEALDQFAAFGAHIDHLRVALPAKVQLLDEEIGEALEIADQRTSEGWAVDGQRAELDEVGESIDGVSFDHLELDLLAISDRVESDEAKLFAINHYLESLPSRVNSLKKWNSGLEAAADLEVRRVEDLRRQFAVLASTHASDSWQWAADYPEQAMEELQQADVLQDVAISEMISEQRFDEAGKQLDSAGLQLIAADHLLDQVDDLIVDLDRALEEAPGIVAQCRTVLANLTEYIAKFQGDLNPDLVSRPPVIARAIDGLEQELRQIKPNFLRVAETGDRLNRQIDELLIAAEEQHLQMEALRRELDREIARAYRSLARARRSLGWEVFKSSDGSALDGLEESLRRLPSEVKAATEKAADLADDALRIQERIIARRRRRSVWVSTGGGGWKSNGGGWSSSGSSRRSGGSSGGRSFGGGSSSGGRSFGGGRSSGSF